MTSVSEPKTDCAIRSPNMILCVWIRPLIFFFFYTMKFEICSRKLIGTINSNGWHYRTFWTLYRFKGLTCTWFVTNESLHCHQINTITEEAAILLYGRFYYKFHLIIHLFYKVQLVLRTLTMNHTRRLYIGTVREVLWRNHFKLGVL